MSDDTVKDQINETEQVLSTEQETTEPVAQVESVNGKSAAPGVEPASTEAAPTEQPSRDTPSAPAPPQAAPADSRPRPKPIPRPRAGKKPALAPKAAPVVAHDEAAEREAATFGRIDEKGTVWVKEASGERAVGEYVDADRDSAMTLYTRRYLDLVAQANLFASRMEQVNLNELDQSLAALQEAVEHPAAVGDLDGLRARVESLASEAERVKEKVRAERSAAKEKAAAERTTIVEKAEKLVNADPTKTHWRNAGEELRTLLQSWREAQRHGPRIDKALEDSLWKRFSHARTIFDRNRRHFFTDLEKERSEAKAVKEKLIQEAEALKDSTDWGATSTAYRELMDRWKQAGRAARKEDDALWEAFRAAQDHFFSARTSHNSEENAEQEANLQAKNELLDKAEALLPIKDLAQVKASLRDIQDKWDEIGFVPRASMRTVESRLKAVEDAVRAAEEATWSKTNPEKKARAEGMSSQLHDAIAQLEREVAQARDAGEDAKARSLEEALQARKAWLEQIERSSADLR